MDFKVLRRYVSGVTADTRNTTVVGLARIPFTWLAFCLACSYSPGGQFSSCMDGWGPGDTLASNAFSGV